MKRLPYTTTTASMALGIPVSTILSWEQTGAIGPFRRDRGGRRELSEDDLASIKWYAEARRRAQGLDPIAIPGDPDAL